MYIYAISNNICGVTIKSLRFNLVFHPSAEVQANLKLS